MSEPLLDQDFIARLERLELVSRKIVSGKLKGERRSRRRGSSTEFADFRPYVPGDDLRFLDWNILGRLDRLFLRVFLEEEDLWLDILVDASESMRWGDPDKFTYARRVAAALGYIGLVQQDRVRVSAFSSRLRPIFGPARGRRQAKRLLEQLESLDVERGEGTHLAPSFERFARTGGRTGIAVVVTDFFDREGVENALRPLVARAATTDVFVFHVLAPQELHPEVAGDLRLVDLEDGEAAEITVSRPLLDAYQRTLDRFRGTIQMRCRSAGMHYVSAPTNVPFDQLLLGYLRRRGLLR